MTIMERLARLVDVKSLVTLALVGVLCVMTVCGQQTSELFNSAVMLVLGFFFGKQKGGGEATVQAGPQKEPENGQRAESMKEDKKESEGAE